MIIGIGTDLVDIRRIERSLERFGDAFCKRIYTASEQTFCDSREGRKRAAAYAMRFAAKEACSKALGTGLRNGVFWRDMESGHLSSGKPVMTLTGGALERLHTLMPEKATPQVDVSLTDEYPYAVAVVIISTNKEQGSK